MVWTALGSEGSGGTFMPGIVWGVSRTIGLACGRARDYRTAIGLRLLPDVELSKQCLCVVVCICQSVLFTVIDG